MLDSEKFGFVLAISFCRIIYLKILWMSIGWSIYMLIFIFYVDVTR